MRDSFGVIRLAVFGSMLLAAAACSAEPAAETSAATPSAGPSRVATDAGNGAANPQNDGGAARDDGSGDEPRLDAAIGIDSALPEPIVDAAPADANDGQADADAGVLCTIDDLTWVPGAPSGEYQVLAKGKLWRIDSSGALVSSGSLSDVDGLAKGPCAPQLGACHLDAFTWRSDKSEYHVIEGGKLWVLDPTGKLLGSSLLTSYPDIAAGPCFGKGPACTFEASAWRSDTNSYYLVQDGILYTVSASGAITGSNPLTNIAGLVAGPCVGQVGTCRIDAFTYRPDVSEWHVVAKGNLYVLKESGALASTTALKTFPAFSKEICK